MPRKICRKILTAGFLTAFLGPMANSAPSVQLALIPNHSTEVKELILEAFLFPDDYRERISEYCSNLGGFTTGSPLLLTSLRTKPSNPQSRTFKTEYETLIKAPNPQQGKPSGAAPKVASPAELFSNGGIPKASELKQWAESQGWKAVKTENGPLKYVDGNGIPRLTIKQGSPRTPGSETPHAEFRGADGSRIDPFGNPVTRKSEGNHSAIEFDL